MNLEEIITDERTFLYGSLALGTIVLFSLIARKKLTLRKLKAQMSNEGIRDSIQLIDRVYSLLLVDRLDKKENYFNFSRLPIEIPELIHLLYYTVFNLGWPEVLRVYVKSIDDVNYRMQLKMIYPDGEKTDSYVATSHSKAAFESSLYSSLGFLRRHGYSVSLLK